ncbi:hypothetical protein EOL96_02955 [Candidatus Saccharibacteria bacterium]|nr:hypothetical protein [Candidatus Saccharibacteria bacterium]
MTIRHNRTRLESTPGYQGLRSRFTSEDSDYNLFTGDKQAVIGEKWDSDYVRERVVEWTNDLIMALDGRDSERDRVVGSKELAQSPPDHVVWMDKSARPVSWLVDAFWDQLAKDGANKPNDIYLNFERSEWFLRIGKTEQDYIDGDRTKFNADLLDEDEILRVRALFTQQSVDEDNWREEMRAEEDLFAGKHLMIVDEVQSTGGATLDISTGILKRAFPGATITTRYFWRGGLVGDITINAGERQMKSAPIWYDTSTIRGRGIGDTNEAYFIDQHEQAAQGDDMHEKARTFKQLLGAHVLSEPLSGFDMLTAQLQQDIAYLTYAYASGKLFLGTTARDSAIRKDIYNGQKLDLSDGQEYRKARSVTGVHKN